MLHQGDARAGQKPPMKMANIISEAQADYDHSERCCQVLDFALEAAGLMRDDLMAVDDRASP